MLLFVLLLVQNIALCRATSGAKFYAASCACYTWYVGPLHEPWLAIENGATVVLLPVQNFVIRFVLLLVRNVVSFFGATYGANCRASFCATAGAKLCDAFCATSGAKCCDPFHATSGATCCAPFLLLLVVVDGGLVRVLAGRGVDGV